MYDPNEVIEGRTRIRSRFMDTGLFTLVTVSLFGLMSWVCVSELRSTNAPATLTEQVARVNP